MRYFQPFPKLLYSTSLGTKNFKLVPNIIAKTKFLNGIKENTDLYYRYSVKDGETAEHISQKIYGSPHKHWIVLISNDIVDPQYDWVMDTRSFNRYINQKYSSYTFSLDNPTNYTPNVFTTGEIVYQGGTRIDSSSAEAKVLSYDANTRTLICNFVTEVFANNTVITGSSSNASNKIINTTINDDGFFWASNTTSHFKVVETSINNFDNIKTTNEYIVSSQQYNFETNLIVDRNTNISYSNSYTLVDGTTNTVETTVSPVSYYDHEFAINEKKRSIVIIKPQYISTIETQFKNLMSI